MQLGKALVGAILGAVVGVVLLVAVHMQWGIDKSWMAIPVAILTGLGVRALVTTYGHESYLRGALTALLALGAFMFGMDRASKIAVQRAANAKAVTLPDVTVPPLEGVGATDPPAATDPATSPDPNTPPADPTPPADATADAAKPAEEAAVPATQPAQPAAPPIQNAADKKPKVVPAQQMNPIDFVWLGVAGLIAYQLGRGSAADPRTGQPVVQPPDAT